MPNTIPWEQRKLGELATFSKGCGYSKSDLRDSGYPIILYGRLYTQYETEITEVDTFIENDINAIKSYGNEVIVPASGETSEEITRASAVGKKGIVIGGDLNIIRPKQGISTVFLALSISNGDLQKNLSKKAQGKSVVHIRNDDLKEVILKYPSYEEQTQIGNFFKQLDDTIALHQRELEKFKILKTSYLENIFLGKVSLFTAKNTITWEQCKLGSILKVKSGMSQKGIEVPNGQYPILATGGEIGRTNTAIYDKESVLIGRKGTIDKPYYMNSPFWTVDTLFYTELSVNIFALFIYYLFQKIGWKSYDTSTGVPSLTSSTIHNISVWIPKSKEEQTQIGNFFKQLDDTITLHQREVKKYKKIKQSYLEKMFI